MKACADLILHNGTIRTQDDGHPMARAVAISGNRILKVGSDRDILGLAQENTKVMDMGNRLVLPGFTDTHFHFYEWALNYDYIDLSKVLSFKGMEEAISKKALTLGRGNWVLGQGFNESDWPENKMPGRNDLDRAAPDNPVCIWRCDLHLAVANSLGLQLAGIGPDTPDPKDGVIEKDVSDLPTGVLKELAPNLIRKILPKLSRESVLENMQKAIGDAHKLGLTSIHDIRLMGGLDGADALKAWQALWQEKKLHIRCHVALPGEMTDQAIALGICTGFGDDLLKIGYLKFFSDGGMGARTGWMTQKYLDAGYGMPLTPVEEIEKAALKADKAGLSVMVHAIGDRANKEIIGMFQRIESKGQTQCRIPHRIEHVQMVLPEDLEKLSVLKNMAASCQPNNLSLDISMIDSCAGLRGKYAYNLKSILKNGIPLMLSSDAPVADPNPLAGIYSAVTRKRMDKTPEKGWYMEQALSVEQAVKGYTITPALVSGRGEQLGSISKGKFADMIVLDQDIFKIDPDGIADTRVDITLFDGRIVHER
ncbi:MAG: amidohydrolase [Desulfobacula sp.]|jgi:predicted amidohydrolase YtcJ|uniref:amidohydrolase n=1 Tax=Desulfobacula sp. TaxID=2593537 RepID=UPI001DB9DB10|nr:amidohydrolase [Desulfobacula sp.]MBT3487610.1 amidohydrolase [Desulfobacula sp.]MBT3806281.1 amidohydrolase [Desulfobacula sp.]MBT4027099.1 amidohydrolase [Desulfobacula sp.]MBT4200521.1 amidohydrolase [Desulfobacula sp.]